MVVIANTIVLGLRDFGVGTDTLVYIDSYYNLAETLDNFHEILVIDNAMDKAFLMLAYISTLFGWKSQMLLLVTELFIIFFVVLGLYQLKKILKIGAVQKVC